MLVTESSYSQQKMLPVPQSLEDAIAQAKQATKAAIEAGCQRVQIELVIPEIALQAQNLAWEFTTLFADYGSGLKVLFPDTGAAALARRDWGEIPFKISDIGTSRTPVELKISDDDQIFLLVSPSSVEVGQVEKLCNLAGDRPVILLIPQLEDVSIVGIGYAARQLRERFISTLESGYYFRPLEGAAVFHYHGSPWQVWVEKEEGYELLTQLDHKPAGEELERTLLQTSNTQEEGTTTAPVVKKTSLLGSLQRFLRALSQ